MPETFAFRLKRFALAVDIVDDDIFRQLWNLILEYMASHLRPKYWALLTETTVNRLPGLAARECSLSAKPAFNLRLPDDSYNGLAALAFLEETPLWIVAEDQQVLGPGVAVRDEWSGASGLPWFDRPATEGIRTVILVPLQWKGRRLGLLDLQCADYQELTNRIKVELGHLADTLSVILPLWEANQERREHTMEAITLHMKALKEEQWPPLTKPQLFVASSDRADSEVMGAVREVLDQFAERLRVHYWRETSEGGNINTTMLRQIQASQFGLCYFSEPARESDGDHRFQDNANVVFEAGMLQALTNSVTDAPTGWIPVRELASPPAPFDFAQERTIVVRRLSDGHPNLEALRAELASRLERMLE